MFDQEEIAHKQQLLVAHRRTLRLYLRQHKALGVLVPAGLVHGIHECWTNIQLVKAALRADGVEVADEPDDEPRDLTVVVRTLSPQEQRNRSRMLQKVRDFWVKGVLENSLHSAVLIALEVEYKPDAVQHPWDMQLQHADQAARSIQPGTKIIDIFDDLGGELLILGAPGSGKTTLLIELARDLIARAEQDETDAIPVVFNLSSWAEKHQPLVEWLVDELNTKYDVPRKIGQEWIEDDQIIPLLDGLDEVNAAQRSACLAAINNYRYDHGLVNLVVCCRVADYEELPIRLKLQAAVLIAPLTNQQIVAYLAGFGEQLDELRLALIADAALRELAAAPLMLSIMALAYQGARAGALAAGGSPEELRKLIFERYIDQMFQRRSKQSRYLRAQTMRWLVTLASVLTRSAQTLFFIEHMQPDWLSPSQRKMFTMGEGLAWGLIAGLIVGIANEFMSLLTALLLWSETKQPDVLKWMLIDGPLGAAAGLTTGVLIGMVAGSLPIGGRAVPTATYPRSWLAIRSAARVAIIVGLAVGVARGVTVGLLQGPLGGVQVGFVRGIQWAAVWGIVAGLGYWLVANPDTISIVETLRWSWSKAKLELVRLLRYAVTLGFVIGLAVGLINGLSEQDLVLGITDGLDLGLAVAIAAWPTLILIEGLTVGEVEARVAPNQGIRRSASNALKVGIGMWMIGGWMLTIVLWLRWGAFWSLNVGLGGGFVLMLIGGLLYGGLACLQHAVLRFILWRNATLPLQLVPFLDYCADRIFLRKVGGGYIFVHRLLMEHFASLDA